MHWFNTVIETLQKYDIEKENIYNMDEIGFAISSTQGVYVIVDARR